MVQTGFRVAVLTDTRANCSPFPFNGKYTPPGFARLWSGVTRVEEAQEEFSVCRTETKEEQAEELLVVRQLGHPERRAMLVEAFPNSPRPSHPESSRSRLRESASVRMPSSFVLRSVEISRRIMPGASKEGKGKPVLALPVERFSG